jgi:hypothetical protein
VPAGCAALAVIAPRTPLSAVEAAAVAEHVARGRGLLVAPSTDPSMPSTGLEALLVAHGLEVAAAVVVETSPRLRLGLPLAFRVDDGHADHPAVRGFAAFRPTAWRRARPVVVTPVAGVAQHVLVASSSRSFSTRDVAGAADVTAPTDRDLLGAQRLVVWAQGAGGPVIASGGGELSLASAAPRSGHGAGDVLVASLMSHLAGRAPPELPVPDLVPSQVRLAMTDRDRDAVFVLCVVILPVGFAAVGAGAAVWRRRSRS